MTSATITQSRPTAERILETAGRLFNQHGYAAVGIDWIVRESGVAKMTLYRYYPSKDSLIVAWLERVDTMFWQFAEQWMAAGGPSPHAQLLGFFDGLERMVSTPQCLGCPFLLAAAEFPASESAAHAVALAHKNGVRGRFSALAAAAGAANATAVGDQLVLLMDGAFMGARLFGPGNPGCHVRAAAAALLAAAGASGIG